MTPLLTKLLAGQLVPVDAAVRIFFFLLYPTYTVFYALASYVLSE